MSQSLAAIALVVRDYDEALDFYVGKLGFTLVEDTFLPHENKRWVVVAPPGSTDTPLGHGLPPTFGHGLPTVAAVRPQVSGCRLLLARASTPEQQSRIGNQTGGRVFLFLHTDDFWRDYHAYRAKGIRFLRDPADHPYGTAAVFEDLYGNLWDLVQPRG